MPWWYWPALPAAGVFIGTASALFGIGGGVLAVPFMVLILGLPQHIAQSTSLALMIPVALVGVVRYRIYGHRASLAVAALLCLGAMAGSYFGAHAASRLSGIGLRRLFGALMTVLGLVMIAKK